jgi:penicillin G amidase
MKKWHPTPPRHTRHFWAIALVAMSGAAFTVTTPSPWQRLFSDVLRANQDSCTTLAVDTDEVQICRDSFGVPHIFAETNTALFQGFGYADAQDRLWQLELFRRAATGRLAEVLGDQGLATNVGSGSPTALSVDLDIRTRFYNEAQLGELSEQFAMLTAEEQGIVTAYADGVNRYLAEVIAPDLTNKLPFEFNYLGIGLPARWTALDVVANAIYQSRFGQIGGQERSNQTLLNNLIRRHCADPATVCDVAWDIFNDIRWKNDPDTPVTVPDDGAVAVQNVRPRLPAREQLNGGGPGIGDSVEAEANAALIALGVPINHGSHTWVIAPARSASGSAMLFSGPQVDFNTPELFHEVQLTGGKGFDVIGPSFAGVAKLHQGRNNRIAWSMTTGTFGDNRDTYIETLCDAGTGAGSGYLFQGTCTAFDTHLEVINVKGALPVACTVRRTVHGPVTSPVCNQPWPTTNGAKVFSQKRPFWKREIASWRAELAFSRAKNINDFTAAIEQMDVAHNVLYADASGTIAYFFAGQVPIRRDNCRGGDSVSSCIDARLPLPGDGSAEWTGEYQPIRMSINPARGWLSNWNSKPTKDYPNPDQRSWGKEWRSLEIDRRLSRPGPISVDDMKDIAKDIARTERGGDGRESRYVLPYLLEALRTNVPAHPLAGAAISILQEWDGVHFDDAVSSETLTPGWVIFSAWLRGLPANTACSNKVYPGILCLVFGDEIPGFDPNHLSALNMLIHVLDDNRWGLGAGSGVPPSRNYFGGCDPTIFINCDPRVMLSRAFDLALSALGTQGTWSTQPRDVAMFRHTLYPAVPEIGHILDANRGSYAFVVVLGHPKPTSESIISLGQSGFISPGLEFDNHFSDQLALYKRFGYRPMTLFDNAQSVK